MLEGCAKPPVEQYNQLTNELKELEALGADRFAPMEYKLARKDIEKIQELMDQQKHRDAKFTCEAAAMLLKALRAASYEGS